MQLLSATAHVPALGGYLPHCYKGRWLYDGLFTDTHPLSANKDAFKISWTPECDCGCTSNASQNPRLFAPHVRMPVRWCMLPPDAPTLRLIFYHGYTRAVAVLSRPDFPRHVLPLRPGALRGLTADSSGSSGPETDADILEALGSRGLHTADSDSFCRALRLEGAIADAIQARVDAAESKWGGCMGVIRRLAVAFRVLFPCIPVSRCVQPLVLGGR